MNAQFSLSVAILLIGVSIASAQSTGAPAQAAASASAADPTPSRAGGGARAAAPVRDPLAAGYVKATELPDGQVPPVEADGNFIIGRTHTPAPEMSPVTDPALKGAIYKFTLRSSESKFYPGMVRDQSVAGAPAAAGAAPSTGANAANANAAPSNVVPWTRTVSVYVPKQYVPGTVAPVMITSDGDNRAFNVLDHLIPEKKLPVMIVVAIPAGGGDGPGSERGLEYDTMSGKYSNFVETEVLPWLKRLRTLN